MLRTLSKTLFFFELLLLGVPVTFFAFFSLLWLGGSHPDVVPFRIGVSLGFVGLFGFWALVLRFLAGGGKAIRQTPLLLWLPVVLGVAMAFSPLVIPKQGPVSLVAAVGAFGIPLLLPLLHMALAAVVAAR